MISAELARTISQIQGALQTHLWDNALGPWTFTYEVTSFVPKGTRTDAAGVRKPLLTLKPHVAVQFNGNLNPHNPYGVQPGDIRLTPSF